MAPEVSTKKQLAILYLSFLDATRFQQPGLQRKPIRALSKPPAPYLHGLVQRAPCACVASLFHLRLLDSVTHVTYKDVQVAERPPAFIP